MSSAGAPQRNIFKELNFQSKKDGKKYTAMCLVCKKTLTNIATQRLKQHRERCNFNAEGTYDIIIYDPEKDGSSEIAELDTSEISAMDISIDNVLATTELFLDGATSSSQSMTPTDQSSSSQSTTPTEQSSTPSMPKECFKVPKATYKKKQGGIENFFDRISSKEEDDLNSCVARFFYVCNIPLSVIDAPPFRELIRKLRPAYEPKMPGRKALSTTLLDKEYEKYIRSAKEDVDSDSVILIDGWKNTASNTKSVVTMLHNANGIKLFLEAFDLSGEQETGNKLCEIVDLSIKKAKDLFNTNVFAVVSDNASNMMYMGRCVDIWHSNCSAHVANLLAKNIVNKELAKQVNIISKEFRHTDLEKRILLKGGTKIKIAAETRWCSYRDCFVCLKKNLPIMRSIVAETDTSEKKVKQDVKQLLFDDDFEEKLDQMISMLNPVCPLLNKVQATSTSIADAANSWLTLKIPEDLTLSEIFRNLVSQALNIYVLTAYYLHPYYDRTRLSPENLSDVTDFLFNNLDGDALKELDLYLNKRLYFGVLLSKNLNNDAHLFWRMASLKYPNLAKVATKLLSIPASSAQIERLFSNWSYVHSDIRNRLSFERSKKLVAIYYKIKINNTEVTEEDSDPEED